MKGLDITGIHLSIKGSIPNITAEQFSEITKGAEQNCIISKALKVLSFPNRFGVELLFSVY